MIASLVSVVIPVHNGERFLRRALDSVLAQDYESVEVIVVNDGSTDGSSSILADYPSVQCIEQECRGVAAARNSGITSAPGEFIALLDQDDYWLSSKLRRQVDLLTQNPHSSIVFCRAEFFLEDVSEAPSWVRSEWLEQSQTGYFPSAWLFRSDLYERIGTFDESMTTNSDADWLFRARDMGVDFKFVDEVLLKRCIHNENESRRTELGRTELLRIIRDSVKRKKDTAPK